MPIANSPLDSARGRGKVRSPRKFTPKTPRPEKAPVGPKIVVLIVQNEKTQTVECHVK
jgi:hypothetical protein